MLYRTAVAAIIVFWLVMAAWLVRVEWHSDAAETLPVPVEFVTKLMFRHEQTADLVLYSQRRRIDGALHLQPHHLPRGVDGLGPPADLIRGSGSFAVNLPGLDAQRIILRGLAHWDAKDQLRRIELTVSLHELKQTGPGLTLFLEGDPITDEWHDVVRQGETTIRENRGPALELLESLTPQLPGLNLSAILRDQHAQAHTARLTAHRGTLSLSGETSDTFVVSVRQGETELVSIQFNQLGQILAVKTFAGYDFYDEGLTP